MDNLTDNYDEEPGALCLETRLALAEKGDTADLSEEMRAHLESCPCCRTFCEQTEKMTAELAALAVPTLTKDGIGLADSVMNEVRARAIFGKKPAATGKKIFRHAGLAAAGFIVLLMAAPILSGVLNPNRSDTAQLNDSESIKPRSVSFGSSDELPESAPHDAAIAPDSLTTADQENADLRLNISLAECDAVSPAVSEDALDESKMTAGTEADKTPAADDTARDGNAYFTTAAPPPPSNGLPAPSDNSKQDTGVSTDNEPAAGMGTYYFSNAYSVQNTENENGLFSITQTPQQRRPLLTNKASAANELTMPSDDDTDADIPLAVTGRENEESAVNEQIAALSATSEDVPISLAADAAAVFFSGAYTPNEETATITGADEHGATVVFPLEENTRIEVVLTVTDTLWQVAADENGNPMIYYIAE